MAKLKRDEFVLRMSREEAEALYFSIDTSRTSPVLAPEMREMAQDIEDMLGEALGE